MSQFQFRLRQVKKLRERARVQAADSLQQALIAAQQLQMQLDSLHQELDEQTAIQNRSSQGTIRTQTVLESQRYQLQLLGHLHSLKEKLDLIHHECQRRRTVLLGCEKEVRVLEKLEQQQLELWKQEQMRNQQRQLDDWASYRHWETVSNGSNDQEGVK
jgi:flagellar export protein FliJ